MQKFIIQFISCFVVYNLVQIFVLGRGFDTISEAIMICGVVPFIISLFVATILYFMTKDNENE